MSDHFTGVINGPINIYEIASTLNTLGFAVIIWTPDELRGVSPSLVEESSIEHGYKVIEMNAETEHE